MAGQPGGRDTGTRPTFPRRDPDGRVERFGDLLVALVAGFVATFALVAIVDVLFAAFGLGGFGLASGWLAAVLPVWLYVEDFRAWRGVRGRIGVLCVTVAISVAAGFAVGATVADLRPLFGGAIAAGTALVVYAPFWFFGIRWLDRQVS